MCRPATASAASRVGHSPKCRHSPRRTDQRHTPSDPLGVNVYGGGPVGLADGLGGFGEGIGLVTNSGRSYSDASLLASVPFVTRISRPSLTSSARRRAAVAVDLPITSFA